MSSADPFSPTRRGIAERAAAAASALTNLASRATARVRPWLDAAGDVLAEAYPGLADAIAEAYPALAEEQPPVAFSWEPGSVPPGVVRWSVDASKWEPEGGCDGAEYRWLCSLIKEREEIQAIEKKRRWEDKKTALLSRLCARRVCSVVLGMDHDDVQIRRTRGRKPFLQNPPPSSVAATPNFNFNVSHAGGRVVLAAEPYCVCGVDVAVRAPHEGRSTAEFLRGFDAQFTEKEWDRIRSAGCSTSQEEAFQGLWACKEAFVKARGDGLGFDVRRSEFRRRARGGVAVEVDGVEQPRWRLHVQRLGRDFFAASARGPPEDVVDMHGAFRRTLRRRRFSDAEWDACLDAPVPPFEEVTVSFLVPDNRRREYAALVGVLSPQMRATAAPEPLLQFRVVWARVRVRNAPGQHAKHVAWRVRGDIVTVVDKVGGWVRLEADGEEQWMPVDGTAMGMSKLLEPIGMARELCSGEDLAGLPAAAASTCLSSPSLSAYRARWREHVSSQGGPLTELAATARVWAVSDLMLGEVENRRWLMRLGQEVVNDEDGVPWSSGTIIVAGNVATEVPLLRDALAGLRRAFQHVFYCVGNLEMWGGRTDSMDKFFSVMSLCAELGVRTTPAALGDSVVVAPLQSWHKTGFGDAAEALNAGCRWPDALLPDEAGGVGSTPAHGDAAARFFMSLNDDCCCAAEQKTTAAVITFSHFLPRADLCTDEERLAGRCVGDTDIDAVARRIGASIHVHGHTYADTSSDRDGVLYMSRGVGPPHVRWMGPATPRVLWSR
eukprot:TRINITY_DN13208_c0_g1_i1.p1 TRINITY_DN13208_c0_g1~~TRINITY_DN13208_c0_g1_i1.p1  ORF type:complete len:777 (+),score=227.58 TRINITY_DN13208_c0_g1_i1:68-2398(+)